MVHQDISNGTESKIRSPKTPKINKPREPKNDLLDSSGSKNSPKRRGIATEPKSAIAEPLKQEIEALPTPVKEAPIAADFSGSNIDVAGSKIEIATLDDQKPDEIIDSVDFFNGDNKLTLRFSKKHNRMYRIQVYLNGHLEVRPVTYTGATTGIAFWELLKGMVKK